MPENVQKEFRLERKDAAELLRDIAESLEDEEQLSMSFGGSRLIQPLSGKVPLRIFQDEAGTEIGFKLQGD